MNNQQGLASNPTRGTGLGRGKPRGADGDPERVLGKVKWFYWENYLSTVSRGMTWYSY